jgi:hypothetical protein
MHYGDQTAMSVMDLRTGVAAPVGRDAASLSVAIPNDGRQAMRILGDQPRTDPHATMTNGIDPPEPIDPATLEGLQAMDAAHAVLRDQLQTGEMTQDVYEEAWTALIATVPPAVLKASMEKRQDAVEAAREKTPGVAKA